MQLSDLIEKHQATYGIELDRPALVAMNRFWDLIRSGNELLHLVAPCSAEEFATRHVLESLTLLARFPKNARFADVGTGGGLPAIPCLIARADLRAFLIESKAKKSAFLQETLNLCGVAQRAVVINRQFEEIPVPDAGFVTCRALDKFSAKVSRLIKWANRRPLLLFGGPNIAEALSAAGVLSESQLMPASERRYLFVCEPVRNQRIVNVK